MSAVDGNVQWNSSVSLLLSLWCSGEGEKKIVVMRVDTAKRKQAAKLKSEASIGSEKMNM
jgi:hypothetical protein